jgi:hypothetical protein
MPNMASKDRQTSSNLQKNITNYYNIDLVASQTIRKFQDQGYQTIRRAKGWLTMSCVRISMSMQSLKIWRGLLPGMSNNVLGFLLQFCFRFNENCSVRSQIPILIMFNISLKHCFIRPNDRVSQLRMKNNKRQSSEKANVGLKMPTWHQNDRKKQTSSNSQKYY